MAEQLKTGDKAPYFELFDDQNRPVALRNQLNKTLIVYFFPKAETPGCTTEACDFRDSLSSLEGAGYRVIGISPDEPAALNAFREHHDLPFSLLSDPDQSVIKAWGAWGEKTINGQPMTGVLRSTVVLDTDGIVKAAYYNVPAQGHVATLRHELVSE